MGPKEALSELKAQSDLAITVKQLRALGNQTSLIPVERISHVPKKSCAARLVVI